MHLANIEVELRSSIALLSPVPYFCHVARAYFSELHCGRSLVALYSCKIRVLGGYIVYIVSPEIFIITQDRLDWHNVQAFDIQVKPHHEFVMEATKLHRHATIDRCDQTAEKFHKNYN